MSQASAPISGEATGSVARSPCVGVCELEAGTGLCRGCLRTMAEISGWSALAPFERQFVLDRLARRSATGVHDGAN